MTIKQLTSYFKLHDHLCDVAQGSDVLDKDYLNQCVTEYDATTTVDQFIKDFADANNCDDCSTWMEVVDEFKRQFISGELVLVN